MPQFAANLTMLFTEVPFLERFKAAHEAGFKAVEFLIPYDYQIKEIQGLLLENDLKVVLFNLPAGDWAGGERGIAVLPGRVEEFREGVRQAVTWARELGTPRLNCLVGKALPGTTQEEQWQTMVTNVRYAADALAAAGLNLI